MTGTSNYIIMNTFALLILGVIYVSIRQRSEIHRNEHGFFLLLLVANAVILVLDTGMWLMDGRPGRLLHTIYLVDTTFFFLLHPFPGLLWSCYADYQMVQETNHLRRIILPLLVPAAILIILVLLTPHYGYVFSISAGNIYQRGPLFFLVAILSFSYLFYTFIAIILRKKELPRDEYYSLLFFALPPLLGGIIQSLYYGISLLWISMTFSLLVIYVNILSKQLSVDHLTGLYNRRQLDHYLTGLCGNLESGQLLAGIMIDLNAFKEINDCHGHAAGDHMLEATGRILKSSLRKDDFIARYGGDEFTVIMTISEKPQLLQAVERIKAGIDSYNRQPDTAIPLSFSMGFDIFDPATMPTIEHFIRHIDRLMYEDKKNYKVGGEIWL